MNLRAIDSWHKTRLGHLVFGLAELGLAYLFISLAIDGGNLWEYLAALIFTVGFLQNMVRMLWRPRA